ncbi:unnamed protein product, partial [Phaeothamnion confervicola]
VLLKGQLDSGSQGSSVSCLLPGDYLFGVSEGAAWADDVSWGFCGQNGGAGDSFPFTLTADGNCTATEATTGAAGPAAPTEVAQDPELCERAAAQGTLASCTTAAISAGFPAGIGAYYDDTCSQRRSLGCGASFDGGGGVGLGNTCRLCLYDAGAFARAAAVFGEASRLPDYVACPCCVAAAFGAHCDTPTPAPAYAGAQGDNGGSGGGGSELSAGDTALVVSTSVAIFFCLAVAVGLLCLRRRDRKRDLRPPVHPAERADKSGYVHGSGPRRGRRGAWAALVGAFRREGRPVVNPGSENVGGKIVAPFKEGKGRVLPRESENPEDDPMAWAVTGKGGPAAWAGEAVVPVSDDAEENAGGGGSSGGSGDAQSRAKCGLSKKFSHKRRPHATPVMPEEREEDGGAVKDGGPGEPPLAGIPARQPRQSEPPRAPAWGGVFFASSAPPANGSSPPAPASIDSTAVTEENGDV